MERVKRSEARVPGAAQHLHSGSKTRVNAPTMVRCRPGTQLSSEETGVPDQRCTAIALHRVRDTGGETGANSQHLEHLDPHRPLLPRAMADVEDAVEPARCR